MAASENTSLRIALSGSNNGVHFTVTNFYYKTGELLKTYGSRTYPVSYGYDYAGRMAFMTNWSSFTTNSGARVTTWTYDVAGQLRYKDYPDPATGLTPPTRGTNGPAYEYTAGGRLKKRTWQRGIVTTYSYGFENTSASIQSPELESVAYSNESEFTTPNMQFTYDRLGRQSTMTLTGKGTTTFSYDNAGQLLGEAYSGGGTLSGLSVVNVYEPSYLRRQSLTLKNGSTALSSWTYGYDGASRLGSVTEGAYSASYTYLDNSSLISDISYKSSSAEKMHTTRVYDKLNRLQSVTSTPKGAAQALLSDGYMYNDANQRTRVTLPDGSYWLYRYDTLGQVISGKRYWSDNTPVAGQQFEYAFDDIGNRRTTKSGGDAAGSSLRSANYTSDYLNRYVSRSNPGTFDVLGVALPASNVTVNGTTPYWKGEYYRQQLTSTNQPGWTNVTVQNGTQSIGNGKVYMPATTENYTYDADGNLKSDSRWTYTWDAENRLVKMVAKATGGVQCVAYEYDGKSRRIRKQVWNTTQGTGTADVDRCYVYDGWNLIGMLTTGKTIVQSYAWGSDLSGSQQGAGGVGGLLWIYDASTMGSASRHFAAYDGNGNLTGLVNASDGTTTAVYEYAPFGEVIRQTGTMAKATPFRFSTKYQDDETDLLYYGYRYYNPSTGRWPSRDPIGERGGLNLYTMIQNDLCNGLDLFGLFEERTGEVNCMGYACGRGTYIGPNPDGSESLKQTVEALGYKCSGPTTKPCEASCNYDLMVVYIYDYPVNPDKRDPWSDPWITSYNNNDFHCIRGVCSGGKRGWTYIGHGYGDGDVISHVKTPPDIHDPDSYWTQRPTPVPVPKQRYCCKKKKN